MKYKFFNWIMILYSLIMCQYFVYAVRDMNPNSWGVSDFLVNYQGGFVRRGFIGQILLSIYDKFHINPIYIITPFSIVCFLLTVAFFIYFFKKRHYCWWILPLEFFLGVGFNIVRKDYLMFLVLICIIYLFIKINKFIYKVMLVNILILLMLIIHEAFIFFSLPIIIILFYHEIKGKNRIMKTFLISLPSIFAFLLISSFKGNEQTALAIHESWKHVFPDKLGIVPESTIESIGWSTMYAIRFHLEENFSTIDNHVYAILVRPFILLLIYYYVTNFLYIFKKKATQYFIHERNVLGYLLVFQFICLIPMFTILSCDYARIVQYWLISSFIIFLLLPSTKIVTIFPIWYRKSIDKFNEYLYLAIPPTKPWFALLTLFICITPVGFHVDAAIHRTVFFTILSAISKIINYFLL